MDQFIEEFLGYEGLVLDREWEDVLDDWIGYTPFMEWNTYYVIARSTFGKLVLWGTNSGQSLRINAPNGFFFPAFDLEEFKEDGADLTLQLFFSSTSRDTYNVIDSDDQPLFERALTKLSPLDHDTMYSFVPALALGGEPSLHLSMLSQITERQVCQISMRMHRLLA